jgi:N-hydroxyarylamine O-acetyltransferase
MNFSDQQLEELFFGICLDDQHSLVELSRSYLEKRSFNNISILLKQAPQPSLTPLDLYEKIVVKGMGGYCFEHNMLIYYGLKDLGIKSDLKLSRVLYGRDGDFPLSHLCITLSLDGMPYLLDLGFGPYNFPGPIPILNKEITYNNERFILTPEKSGLTIRTYRDGKQFDLYQFEDRKIHESDINVSNFYTSNSTDSKFTNDLIISKHIDGEKIFINNLVFTRISEGLREDSTIRTPDQLKQIIGTEFQIQLTSQESTILFNLANKRSIK